MNKNIMWIVLLLLGIGVVWYLNPTVGTNLGQIQQADSAVTPMTLRGLVTGQESLMCTYTGTADEDVNEGTVYVAGGRMRGDFTSTVEGVTTMSHMMVDNNTTYVWSDGEPQGMMMAWTQEDAEAMVEEVEETEETEATTPFDPDEEVDYDCEPWREDASMFTLPQGVEFVDFQAMMEDAMEGMMGADALEQMEEVMEGEN
jgi:hypothetical protein